ncbi:malt-1, partial [Pristionchus pacificus]|uniref:Peptidase n=1 Tax=Pristionchus pacificus TaxID=54126 RepID=A0A2A6CTC3_PRIPA
FIVLFFLIDCGRSLQQAVIFFSGFKSMTLRLDTNLAELPLPILNQLSSSLNQNETWLKVLDNDKKNAFYSSPEEIDKVTRQSNPAEAILQRWGNRGQNVQSLIVRLQWLSFDQGFGVAFDRPQLVLKRKFKALRWASEANPIKIVSDDDRQEICLKARAVGFPSPQFEWLRDGEPVGVPGRALRVSKCKCEATCQYICRVWNEVEDGQSFSDFYRVEGKQYSSELRSNPVDLTSHVQGTTQTCDRCKTAELEKIREKLGGSMVEDGVERPPSEQVAAACEQLVAADKVALIISNCSYLHLPPLRTPHCDAETLAGALQELHFKTVTLADLTLAEMKYMIGEYRRLLGNDVYAVLYFAGHGFEVNGQCYLLPVEAPLEAHSPEFALSMHWVLASLDSCSPALHLILLDVCRKYVPEECVPLFLRDVGEERKHKPNRNTVYGYSTSGGIAAYEVKGEVNGVFMSALKMHVKSPVPVVDMIQRVLVDIHADERVEKKQIPELRTTLTKKRSLCDELICDGHTASFDRHNVHWTLMHELPMPVYITFEEQQLTVTIWFDFCGRFTNKVYVFSSVDQLRTEDNEEGTTEGEERAMRHLAYLRFSKDLDSSPSRLVTDEHEGQSMCVLLSHLQKSKGPLECTVELTDAQTKEVVASRDTALGDVLITKVLSSLSRRN